MKTNAELIARLQSFPPDAVPVLMGAEGPIPVASVDWVPMPGRTSEHPDPDSLTDLDGRPYSGMLIGG